MGRVTQIVVAAGGALARRGRSAYPGEPIRFRPTMPPTNDPPTTEPTPFIRPMSAPAAPAAPAPAGSVVRPSSVPRATAAQPGIRWRHELLRLLLGLPLIFVSVYLAFLATRYQEAQERAGRATQLRAALRQEVLDIGARVAGVHRRLGAELTQLDSAARAGAPQPLRPRLDMEAIQPHMWQTAMQSGALDLLDVATVWRLSEFYNQLAIGRQQLRRMGELSERVLLPVAGAPAAEYWLPTGELRPRYQWYTATLDALHETTGTLAAQSDSLALLLAPPGRR